jgi:uncharacterized membrane protein
MTWNRAYVIKSYIRGSLWLVPFFSMVLYAVVSRITNRIGLWLLQTGRIDEKTAFHGLDMAGARSMLDMIITLNMSFLVFTFGSLLVAIQVAGGQYTPRIIATTLLRDNAIRFTVGYFVFTLLFAQHVLTRMHGDMVHQFNTFIASMFGMISVVMFLYLIDHAARMLRPVSIVRRVGTSGIAVIESMYPDPTKPRSPGESSDELASRQRIAAASLSAQAGNILQRLGNLGIAAVKNVYSKPTAPAPTEEPARRRAPPDRVVTHARSSGIVLAVDLARLVAEAQRANGTIEFVPQVGDFVAVDEPLFRLYDGAAAIDDSRLRGAVAFGSERTIEQDPTFAFRILVDIAIKALSAAINDPTTAVTAIDQIHRLLRLVGLRDLRDEEICDAAGEVRLVFRTPNWEDFVHLSCIEIRHCGVGSVQVVRRMRSMLENLMQTLPPHRRAELHQQLELLDRAIEDRYTFAEDRALARMPDPQGLGGSLGVQPVSEHTGNQP